MKAETEEKTHTQKPEPSPQPSKLQEKLHIKPGLQTRNQVLSPSLLHEPYTLKLSNLDPKKQNLNP